MRSHVIDEREVLVTRKGLGLGFLILSFGLLAIACVRIVGYGQSGWDLLGLFVLGNVAVAVYMGIHKVYTWKWGAIMGGVFGFVFGFLYSYIW
ncbi:hypothetical protein JD969_14830 [Planctomycetota bacterium]|nr:hypothetical protein JD969_14830 [Planctomycetota bacterium]